MANDPVVTVSLVQPMRYRANKGDDYIKYPVGHQNMPRSHAVGMGLTHRIIKEVEPAQAGEPARVVKLPFDGAFNAKLSDTLTNAGYQSLVDLAKASREELLALDGIGPAAYEEIANALSKGGK